MEELIPETVIAPAISIGEAAPPKLASLPLVQVAPDQFAVVVSQSPETIRACVAAFRKVNGPRNAPAARTAAPSDVAEGRRLRLEAVREEGRDFMSEGDVDFEM